MVESWSIAMTMTLENVAQIRKKQSCHMLNGDWWSKQPDQENVSGLDAVRHWSRSKNNYWFGTVICCFAFLYCYGTRFFWYPTKNSAPPLHVAPASATLVWESDLLFWFLILLWHMFFLPGAQEQPSTSLHVGAASTILVWVRDLLCWCLILLWHKVFF